MAKKETAEQKLLKLIETSQGSKPQTADSPQPAGASGPTVPKSEHQDIAKKVAQSVQGVGGVSFSAPNFLKNLLRNVRIPMLAGAHSSFGLRELNAVLLLLAGLMAVYLAFSVMSGLRTSNEPFMLKMDVQAMRGQENRLTLTSDVATYVDVVKTRNIFKPYEGKPKAGPIAATGGKRITQKTGKLKLRGISWFNSAESASVMIEDTESGVTYFLKQGEQIKDVTVKTIYADQVILGFDDEETILKL